MFLFFYKSGLALTVSKQNVSGSVFFCASIDHLKKLKTTYFESNFCWTVDIYSTDRHRWLIALSSKRIK